VSRSSDGRLDIKLSIPGTPGAGTNPEQLFAAGWSACFEGAMVIAARKRKIVLPADLAIETEVDLCMRGDAYFLQARLNVPARRGARSRPGSNRRSAPDLSVFQSHARQHRRRDQPALSRSPHQSGLPELIGQAVSIGAPDIDRR
jgi:OsmC-like protein